jgi:hypothetical protein
MIARRVEEALQRLILRCEVRSPKHEIGRVHDVGH